MSSTRSAPPLWLGISFSRQLAGLLILLHVGAGTLLFVLPWPLVFSAAFASLLLAQLVYVIRHLPGYARAGNIQAVEWCADGRWLLHDFAGEPYLAQLLPSSFVHPWLVILNFRLVDKNGRRSLALLADAADSESLRSLRLRLGIEGLASEQNAQR